MTQLSVSRAIIVDFIMPTIDTSLNHAYITIDVKGDGEEVDINVPRTIITTNAAFAQMELFEIHDRMSREIFGRLPGEMTDNDIKWYRRSHWRHPWKRKLMRLMITWSID